MGENIIKSIDEGPFKMGKFRDTLAEGALHLGPERDRVVADLHQKRRKDTKLTCVLQDNVKMLLEGSKLTKVDRESQLYDDFEHFRQNKGETIHEYYIKFTKLINDMRNIKITMPKMQLNSKFVSNMLPEWGRFITAVKLNRGLKEVIVQNVQGRQNRGQGNNARGAVAAGNGGFQNRIGNASPGQAKPIKCYNYNGIGYIARQCTHPKRKQNSKYFEDKMLLMQAQENGVVLDEEQLLFIAGGQTNTFDDDVDEAPVQYLALNEDNVFQADQCDAFDSDVDETPTSQTMFMANLSSADLIYDEAGPSYDSDILSEVQDHDNYLDSVDEYQEVHEMHNDVQQNYVVDSNAEYMSDSNIILYDQYVKNNVEQVVQSNVPSVPNDALMMIINDMHDQTTECVYVNEQNKVVNESLTAELVRYKEQVLIYEKRARRVATLKKDFKQKEDKYLEEFLDIKKLKEEVEDRLFKQDQSVQTVHMLCKPKPFYDEKKKVAIGYKNPLCLTRAKQVQSALYNGHEIVMTNHAPPVMHDSEDTLEIAEITRKRMIEKIKSPLNLTPEQIFWSHDISKTVKTVPKPLSALTMKNLLIENENLIANYLSNQLLYVVEQSRCLDLEAEISKLQNENQKDVNNEMIKSFKKLEVEYLNLQLRYQHLQENFGNNKSQTSQDAPEFDSFFKINNLKERLQEKDNTIRNLKDQVSKLNDRRSEAYCTQNVKALDSQNLELTEHVTALFEINERFRAENEKGSVETVREIVEEARIANPLDNALESACLYTKHSQEMLEYVIETCPKKFNPKENKATSTLLISK
ncbi:hypothetical protein Tco_1330459, partial [Tanacetum coccineum]